MDRLTRLMSRYSLPEPENFNVKSDEVSFTLTCHWPTKKTWLEILPNRIIVTNRKEEAKFNDLNLAVRSLTNFI